ncbi:MAG TPA: glycosyltransferase, partial [Acidimicrobiales bacterium]
VIGRTVQRLLEQRRHNLAVLVIDDASDDSTASIVEAFPRDRVWLLRRSLPDARKGKGEALNAGFRHLCQSDLLRGWPSNRVIVGVLDADGRLEPGALAEVERCFGDPRTGGVQIGVRMYNRDGGLLARMQDIEFATIGRLFQRGRDRIGSAGLGGNGQFTRLLALRSIGPAPWSRCLTEDLELGLQLHVRGWHVRYCGDVSVAQQALLDVRRLVRQRARWFQGYLQCLSLLTLVTGSPKVGLRKRIELGMGLILPVLLLLNSVAILLGFVAFVSALVSAAFDGWDAGRALRHLPVLYAFSFATVPLVACAYRQVDKISWLRAVALAHAYVVYSNLVWLPAGWRAAVRAVRGQDRWDKTERTASAADVIDLRDVIDVREPTGAQIA